ncbi:unnamed protein product [Orchesella dallaii]|uniref:Methyltransferase domain-containing protein n=1 Tax=Orchesella dallaii TaxID=48710 RepID=A0ABP1QHH4_9HEXA
MASEDNTATPSVTKLEYALAISGTVFVSICIITGAWVLGSMSDSTQDGKLTPTSGPQETADIRPTTTTTESIYNNIDDIINATVLSRIEDFVNKPTLDVWNSIKPSIQCPLGLMQNSLGGEANEFVVCGLNVLQKMKTRANLRTCLFYTFGSDRHENKAFDFEEETLVNTNCNIFAFISTCKPKMNPLIQTWNKRISFVKAEKTKNETELKHYMEANGHEEVDVLKADVDMYTIDVLEANSELMKQVGQLVLRFRWNEGLSLEVAGKFMRILERAQNLGFRLFHAQSECYAENQCKSDFSFLNFKAWGQYFLIYSKVEEEPI